MESNIFPAKLSVPQLPVSYLPRPRLDRLWREWKTKRLLLVTAGAGFGKTSFLAPLPLPSYLKTHGSTKAYFT